MLVGGLPEGARNPEGRMGTDKDTLRRRQRGEHRPSAAGGVAGWPGVDAMSWRDGLAMLDPVGRRAEGNQKSA